MDVNAFNLLGLKYTTNKEALLKEVLKWNR